MEYGLLEDGLSTLEKYIIDQIAFGKAMEDIPNVNPQDLEGDIKAKWKMEELEQQMRSAKYASQG